MTYSRGAWGQRRIGQCQICKRWVRRNTLRMMPHDRLVPGPGANHLLYSRYNDPYWTCSSTLAGMTSVGVEDTRVKYEPYDYGYVQQDPNTLLGDAAGESHTVVNAAPSWIGTGVLYTSAGIDVSTWSSVTFAIWVGYSQGDVHSLATSRIGIYNSYAGYQLNFGTFDVVGSRFVWGTVPVSEIPSAAMTDIRPFVWFYTATTDCEWWSDDAQMEDATKPGIYYQTNGAAVVTTGDQWIRTVASTCPRCREKLFDLGKLRGKPRQEVDKMIPHEKLEEG